MIQSDKKKEAFKFPYSIGTIVEAVDNPNKKMIICQYRITTENNEKVLKIGLRANLNNEESNPQIEATLEELYKNWRQQNTTLQNNLKKSANQRVYKK